MTKKIKELTNQDLLEARRAWNRLYEKRDKDEIDEEEYITGLEEILNVLLDENILLNK